MATLRADVGIDINRMNLNYFIDTSTEYQFDDDITGYRYPDYFHIILRPYDSLVFGGNNFGYNQAGEMVKGTVKSITQWYTFDNGATWNTAFHLTGVSVSMRDVFDAVQSASRADDMALLRQALSGDDKLFLSFDHDDMRGFDGDDRMIGYQGNDHLFGDAGRDYLAGGSGNDVLAGGRGNDQLSGGAGRDFLAGGAGRDVLVGGAGRDILIGGRGNDRLIGGKGADVFVFADGGMTDKVKDFDATGSNHDRVDLSDFTAVTGWRDLKAHHMSQDGANVVIDSHLGDVLILVDVQLGDLDKGDFIF